MCVRRTLYNILFTMYEGGDIFVLDKLRFEYKGNVRNVKLFLYTT